MITSSKRLFSVHVRVVKFTMKGIVARTSGRLIQGGMIGHAPCKKFELHRNVYGEILRGLPTDINIPPRGQPK